MIFYDKNNRQTLALPDPVRIVCKGISFDGIHAELAVHRIDLVIADGPIPSSLNVRGYHHPLGESGFSFLALAKLAKALRKNIPPSLNGAPLLISSEINRVQARSVVRRIQCASNFFYHGWTQDFVSGRGGDHRYRVRVVKMNKAAVCAKPSLMVTLTPCYLCGRFETSGVCRLSKF